MRRQLDLGKALVPQLRVSAAQLDLELFHPTSGKIGPSLTVIGTTTIPIVILRDRSAPVSALSSAQPEIPVFEPTLQLCVKPTDGFEGGLTNHTIHGRQIFRSKF